MASALAPGPPLSKSQNHNEKMMILVSQIDAPDSNKCLGSWDWPKIKNLISSAADAVLLIVIMLVRDKPKILVGKWCLLIRLGERAKRMSANTPSVIQIGCCSPTASSLGKAFCKKITSITTITTGARCSPLFVRCQCGRWG